MIAEFEMIGDSLFFGDDMNRFHRCFIFNSFRPLFFVRLSAFSVFFKLVNFNFVILCFFSRD